MTLRLALRLALVSVAFLSIPLRANGTDLDDPPVLESRNGKLDVLIVAREQQLKGFPGAPIGPIGWVYEVCRNDGAGGNARRCPVPGVTGAQLTNCPKATDPVVSPYGGVRLALGPTDRLRIRLVNCLPKVAADQPDKGDFKHVGENGDTLLQYNPTNLHTHGLIVEPRRADHQGGTYGDYVFVLTINPANKPPASFAGQTAAVPAAGATHADHARYFDLTTDGVINYDIDLTNHPSGLFWFHPHAHGLSLNQISAGMAGIITVGDPNNYVCDDPACTSASTTLKTRYLVLKDTQLRADGTLQIQEDPKFCGVPVDGSNDLLGKGLCPGATTRSGSTTSDYRGGKWYFTINGVSDPQINVDAKGELWRMINTSGSATYWMGLRDDLGIAEIPFQVLSIDGISIETVPDASIADLQKQFSTKFVVVACPAPDPAVRLKIHGTPVCATRVRMMPSSRVELFVLNRPENAQVASVVQTSEAVLRSYSFSTGDAGDTWPGVELAHVTFQPSAQDRLPSPMRGWTALAVRGEAKSVLGPAGALGAPASTRVEGIDKPVPLRMLRSLAKSSGGETAHDHAMAGHAHDQAMAAGSAPLTGSATARIDALNAATQVADCSPLPAGKVRQIIFGLPGEDPNSNFFGLGYRVADKDRPLAAPTATERVQIKEFDHTAPPTVCLQLGRGGAAVTERWELVNVSAEDHNFHVHQTRFVLAYTQLPGDTATPEGTETSTPNQIGSTVVLHDNVPVPRGVGCDGTIGAWQKGACKPSRLIVDIPFSQVGDFVFHCHILEHEDGGMMAKVSVVPNAAD